MKPDRQDRPEDADGVRGCSGDVPLSTKVCPLAVIAGSRITPEK